jgi:hypothetical protein
LQQSTQINFHVARIGAESFFGFPLAKAARLEIVKELLPEIGNKTLQPATDSSFVNVKNAGDL